MYEIFEKLLEMQGLTIYKFCKINKISESTIYTWRKKKSVVRPDLAKKVCEFFGISMDFLMGRTEITICPVCGFGNSPLSEQSNKEHEEFHERFLKAKEKFPFLMPYNWADDLRGTSIAIFRSKTATFEEKIKAFDTYLDAAFSLELARSNFEYESISYEDFRKVEVGMLSADHTITQQLIDAIIEKYGIETIYSNGYEQLLARVSKNAQLMRMLAYLDKIDQKQRDILEIQIKALAEQKEKEYLNGCSLIFPL